MGGPGTSYVVSLVPEFIGRYSVSSGERNRMMVKPCACDTRQGLRVRCCGACSSILCRGWAQ